MCGASLPSLFSKKGRKKKKGGGKKKSNKFKRQDVLLFSFQNFLTMMHLALFDANLFVLSSHRKVVNCEYWSPGPPQDHHGAWVELSRWCGCLILSWVSQNSQLPVLLILFYWPFRTFYWRNKYITSSCCLSKEEKMDKGRINNGINSDMKGNSGWFLIVGQVLLSI